MQRVAFGYDTVDQLTSEVLSEGGTPQWSKSFAYDAMGNRTAAQSVTSPTTVDSTYISNKLHQVTAISSTWGGGANTLASSLLYDQSGNLTKWTSTGTGEATPAHTEYIYDDSERLIAVVKKNPTTQANLSKSEFVYDGDSRLRISREFNWVDAAWVLVPNTEKRRIYDGMDVIQERDGNNAIIATYTRDGNIGGILSKRDSNEDDYFFHYDGSGNVVGMTDEDQNSVAEYAYGNLQSSSGGQASNNLYRYSTKEYFTHAGLYNYGLRFYSSGLGRWINRDPIAEAGGLNLYAAFANTPMNLTDAYGLASDPPGKEGRIRVVFNAFIPTAEVDAPGLREVLRDKGIISYGDNRGMSSTGGTYKVMHTAVINPKTGQMTSWEDPGESQISWPIIGKVGIEGHHKMNSWVRENKCEGGWDITFRGNSANGYDLLFGFGPAISYEMDMHVSPEGRVTGAIIHDPYPAYEIWLYTGPTNNATPIYQQYPVKKVYGIATPWFN